MLVALVGRTLSRSVRPLHRRSGCWQFILPSADTALQVLIESIVATLAEHLVDSELHPYQPKISVAKKHDAGCRQVTRDAGKFCQSHAVDFGLRFVHCPMVRPRVDQPQKPAFAPRPEHVGEVDCARSDEPHRVLGRLRQLATNLRERGLERGTDLEQARFNRLEPRTPEHRHTQLHQHCKPRDAAEWPDLRRDHVHGVHQ